MNWGASLQDGQEFVPRLSIEFDFIINSSVTALTKRTDGKLKHSKDSGDSGRANAS